MVVNEFTGQLLPLISLKKEAFDRFAIYYVAFHNFVDIAKLNLTVKNTIGIHGDNRSGFAKIETTCTLRTNGRIELAVLNCLLESSN